MEPLHKELHRYSLLRAIRRRIDRQDLDGIEGEVSKEIAKRAGTPPMGIFCPLSVLATPTRVRRALTTTTAVGALKTAVSSDYIEALRPLSVLARMGARVMEDMIGTFKIPHLSAGGTGYWVTPEGSAPTSSAPTIDQVSLSPKICGAHTEITRPFAVQSSPDAEDLVKRDLLAAVSSAIDAGGINGSGTAGQPTGLLNNGNIATHNCGGTLAWSDVVGIETTVGAANVMITSGAYLTTPSVKGLLKATPKVGTTYPVFMWEGNELNGYPAYASNVVPSNLGSNNDRAALIFGNWEDMVIGMWGAVDLLVDPYTQSTTGTIGITVLVPADIQPRRNESFVCIPDVTTPTP
ncbi:MAG TPA: phage major capsid protein [Phycisphaerae bacterium]|nr:phage major capsid protein [Phycisphaerae bacterium]